MNQKESAVTFLKMAGSGDVGAAYDKFIASDFIHHNQYFKGDRESLLKAMEEAHKKSPNKSIEVKHVYQDGNNIITHSQVLRRDPNAAPVAVVHIFRFESNHVVELWDLGQEILKDSPDENGAF
jgi:predicted SnoaL-like aldol condensation-catalyzing enzyme